MQLARLRIKGVQQDELIACLDEKFSFDYKSVGAVKSVLVAEKYYIRTNSDQLNLVIIIAEEDYLNIHLIGGGGGTGWMKISWGSELSFIRKAGGVIEDLCARHQALFEEIE